MNKSDIEYWATQLRTAQAAARPRPLPSGQYPGLTLAQAYEIQRVLVRQKTATTSIVGYKAGLTTTPLQKKFAVPEATAGVLLRAGERQPGDTISLRAFSDLWLECEIGYFIGQAIHRPVQNKAALQAHITAIAPVIELPDLGFEAMSRLTGADIAAANTVAAQFMVGATQRPADFEVNAVRVTLTRNGEVVNTGQGIDSQGDQWQTACWLVNHTLAQGYTIEAGQFLITGALGPAESPMIPGCPGQYVADYGDFGTITFEVEG